MNTTVQKKPSSKLTVIYIAIIAVILLVTGVYISIEYDAVYVLKSIKRINPLFIFLGFSMLFVQLYCEAFSIKQLFSLLGIKVKLKSAAGYAGTDLFYSNISPAQLAGLPAAGYSMYKDGIDAPSSCTVLAIYSMCNRLAVIILAAVSVIVYPLLLRTGSAFFITLLIYGTIVNLGIVALFAVCVFAPALATKLIPAFVSYLCRFKFLHINEDTVAKARCSVIKYTDAAKIMRSSPMTVIAVLVTCIFKRISNFSIVFFVYLAFGLSGESFPFIMALQSVLAVSAESVPVPGAAGVTESVFISLYSGVFGPRLYITATVVTRVLNFFALLVVSGAYTLIHKFCSEKVVRKI